MTQQPEIPLKRYDFKLHYRGKLYCQAELSRNIDLISAEPSGCLAIASEQRFSTVLYLLYGWINRQPVFPLLTESVSPELGKLTELLSRNLSELQYSFALAIATSGSQGKAKIALLSEQNITAHCRSLIKQIPLNEHSVWLNCLPLNHIAGVMIIYRCWFNNAAMLLHDGFDVQQIWQDIHQLSVSHISLVPRMLARLLDFADKRPLPESLKFIIVGGDKLSNRLLQRVELAGWPVIISYGMTEASSTIALGKSPEQLKPLQGFKLSIAQDAVLHISGEMLISAYAQCSTDGCYPDSRAFTGEFYQTSDRVNWDGEYLSIVGRNDEMLICGGKNIAPQYIESLLMVSEYINDVAVGKIPHDEWGDTIVALVCTKTDRVEQWIKVNIPREFQPQIILSIEQIPRNTMGKINRKQVQILIDKMS